ncbi:LysR substrate-binding domain-containing protein [Amphritea sp. 2_MG-2023]|uniref:LysR family transcriptional regulator n=1 Tax=Amphritea TaxID=515417 RepID=UPI001C07C444|nr:MULTISPECIES: LysR family transcriptional regulator [Amphritea]MBU2967286.1 LysR family transcriptional regulator [Amphritea atlantica]MDO6420433.1 LysR substrate-binding domain-containing protein [Amphritea sp. 2_MG-2023]
MELKLLEDYLALVDFGSFSKAANARSVTQPAFGRRIRSLENWLGFELVDRQKYPTTLTPAGKDFTAQARELTEQFYNIRAEMREQISSTKRITFVAQHHLAVSFLPHWIKPLQSLTDDTRIRINADNLHDCLDTLMSDQGDFLLCYHSPDIFPQLEQSNVLSLQVGTDQLIPVSTVNETGMAVHQPYPNKPLKLLNYPDESFFGRLLQRSYFSHNKPEIQFQLQCENALVEGLKALTLAGNGLAWLPASGITQELEQGVLIRCEDMLPSIELKVMLYRKQKPRVKEVEVIWNYLKNVNK